MRTLWVFVLRTVDNSLYRYNEWSFAARHSIAQNNWTIEGLLAPFSKRSNHSFVSCPPPSSPLDSAADMMFKKAFLLWRCTYSSREISLFLIVCPSIPFQFRCMKCRMCANTGYVAENPPAPFILTLYSGSRMALQLADYHCVSILSSVPFPITEMMIRRDERMFELYLL